MMEQQRLPTLFVPHGSPLFVLRSGAAAAALTQAPKALPRPRAIVVVSAHWCTEVPHVGFAAQPETIHDYWGFPDELYSLRYPAVGDPTAAAEVLACLQAAGFPVVADEKRGLDHGAWIPLHFMFPAADVPVIPVSLQPQEGPEYHLRLGQALASLTDKGFLVIGSGNLTHNLRDFQLVSGGNGVTPAYVREFAEWIWQRLAVNDIPALLDYRHQAPNAERAHPTDEHLLPLYVALGAAGEQPQAARLYTGVDDYVLAMDMFSFAQK